MYQIIHASLYRQRQAFHLLQELLQEEYELLLRRDTGAVMSLEFSLHELIRQLAVEKNAIISILGGGKVMDYAALLPDDQGQALRTLFAEIDEKEQASSRQASRNAELSLALLDQSQRTMQELHSHIIPPSVKTYGRRGVMGTSRPQASLISGRM